MRNVVILAALLLSACGDKDSGSEAVDSSALDTAAE